MFPIERGEGELKLGEGLKMIVFNYQLFALGGDLRCL